MGLVPDLLFLVVKRLQLIEILRLHVLQDLGALQAVQLLDLDEIAAGRLRGVDARLLLRVQGGDLRLDRIEPEGRDLIGDALIEAEGRRRICLRKTTFPPALV